MSVIKSMRRQKAIWWEQNGTDHYGRRLYKEPQEIACRWDDGSMEIRGAQGEVFAFNATVYVDRVMRIGDMLKRGDLESDTVDDPTKDPNAMAIQRFVQNPNFKATETLLTAYL